MIFVRSLLSGRRGFLCFSVVAVLICIAATVALGSRSQPPLLQTANKLGPSAESLIQGRGLANCYGEDASHCFHAQRMPVAPFTLAGLYLVFHEHRLAAAVLKALLCFAPVLAAFALVWRRAQERSTRTRLIAPGLFLLAQLLPPALDLVVNLNFEEAYFYGAFTLSVALLLFPGIFQSHPRQWAVAMWLALTVCYLTKSSMLLPVGFMAVAAFVYMLRFAPRPGLAFMFLFVFACVPLLWGCRQQQASGRFTTGTSLDGVNLYKGNNAFFLDHYPAFRGASLDPDEAALFADHVSLTDEWDQNSFGFASARTYIRTHPATTVQADLRKASVFFLGVQRDTGEEEHTSLLEDAFTAGMILFRILLFAASGLALRRVLVAGQGRFAALAFLGITACAAAPYVAGFALTRHATVLIFPCAVYLCRALCDSTGKSASATV